VGTIVTIKAVDMEQRSTRRSGDSYLSHSDNRLHLGLGSRTRVDSIDVRWPDGATQRFEGIAANTFIKIVEGAREPILVAAPKPTPASTRLPTPR
jgi:hypothetical protein